MVRKTKQSQCGVRDETIFVTMLLGRAEELGRLLVAVPFLLMVGGCSGPNVSEPVRNAAPSQGAFNPDPGMGEDSASLTLAGPLQGNWRVTRPNDPSDAAIMLVHVIQDGPLIEGSYVLYQPFCGIDLPPVRAGAETCEFDGVSAGIEGEVVTISATLVFAPGADGLDHRLVFGVDPAAGPLNGNYFAPNQAEGTPVILTRAPE